MLRRQLCLAVADLDQPCQVASQRCEVLEAPRTFPDLEADIVSTLLLLDLLDIEQARL